MLTLCKDDNGSLTNARVHSRLTRVHTSSGLTCKITCTTHDAINRSHELSKPSLASFSPSLKSREEQSRIMKDNGGVDIRKSDQQIRESAVITLAF